MNQKKLTAADFAKLFGTDEADLPAECLALINQYNFNYTIPEGAQKDKLLLDIISELDNRKFTRAAESKDRWEKGWGENWSNFQESQFDLDALTPKYIRPNEPVRLFQNYVIPEDNLFEKKFFEVLSTWFFLKYLKDYPTIIEFGCGSGINIAKLSQLFPAKTIYGTDWVQPSVNIVNGIGQKTGQKIQGQLFDFFHPDESFKIAPDTAVFTIGALEQTSDNYTPFLNYILKQKPPICLHIEPIREFYDMENSLIDYLGAKFHRIRGYWEGFPEKIEQLAKEGKAEILKKHRSHMGSKFIDGYSQFIWRPL